ncbi:MAG: glycosyltransferase family 9 protein, partial [Verrucomicrobiota bacterium]
FGRILVIVTRQLGDVLLTTPLIRAARTRWPKARIDVLGFSGTLGLLRGNTDIDELIEVPGGAGWRASWPFIKRLWRRYDLALIGQPSDRAHLYGFIAGKRRSGLVTWQRSKSWWQRLLLAHVVEVVPDRSHVVLEKLALLAPWAPPVAEVSAVTPAEAPLPDAVLAALQPGYLVVQVPSLVHYKQWPLAHFKQLLPALLVEGRQVVLTGSGSPADLERVAEVAAPHGASPAVLNLAGALNLNQVATLLAGASLYIGPDTSITHLATACRVPVIALYGPVDPRIFGPWPQGHSASQPWVPRADRQVVASITLLQGPQPCVPCNGAGCEGHNDSRSDCLIAITPQRVLSEARRVLGQEARSVR